VSVPLVDTGDPVTVIKEGSANPTLVTVPLPPPMAVIVMLPAPLVTLMPDPAVIVAAATDEPVEPTYSSPSDNWGKSAKTCVRNVGGAGDPVTGPTNTAFAG
jgi:hypothetical protein